MNQNQNNWNKNRKKSDAINKHNKTYEPKRNSKEREQKESYEELANIIMNQHMRLFYDGQRMYIYDNGVYKPNADWQVKKHAKDLLQERAGRAAIENILYLIEIESLVKDRYKINPNDGLLNVKNGLLNLQNGTLLPHSPNRISTVQIPVTFDPTAYDEQVIKFLQDVVPEDTFETLIEIIGYCLLPHTKYEKAFMFTGTGANGKSTFINMLMAFLGTENVVNIDLHSLEIHKFKVAELNGKLVNCFADLPNKGLAQSSIFKSVVSGDRLTAERKNKDPFEFTPFAKLIFSANELPSNTDVTDGYFRRWIIIPFPRKFTPEQADTNLIHKLTTPKALSTLLNLALEGIKRLEVNRKFTERETIKEALKQYQKDSDKVITFVEESCLIDGEATIKIKDLYQTFQNWSRESNIGVLGKGKFNNRIERKYNLTKTRIKGETSQRWIGIRLVDEFGDWN